MAELATTPAPSFPSWKEAQRQALSALAVPAGRTTAPAPAGPRYVGSLTECHGEVLTVDDCDAGCCAGLDPWDQPHATLWVRCDSDGQRVKLQRVRFQSFTGRP